MPRLPILLDCRLRDYNQRLYIKDVQSSKYEYHNPVGRSENIKITIREFLLLNNFSQNSN